MKKYKAFAYANWRKITLTEGSNKRSVLQDAKKIMLICPSYWDGYIWVEDEKNNIHFQRYLFKNHWYSVSDTNVIKFTKGL